MSISIRTLRADEIEVRVQSTKETQKGVGAIMLLYKDARCDMRILDETFGVTGWQRTHELINGNLFCNIEIWDDEKKCWIRKQDVGTQSNTEKEKGQASDSFKRAGVNIGIGRELYTSPFIWVNLNADDYSKKNDKVNVSQNFSVSHVGYNDNREIIELSIVDKNGVVRFTYKDKAEKPTDKEKKDQADIGNKKIDNAKLKLIQNLIDKTGTDTEKLCQHYKIKSLQDMTVTIWNNAITQLKDKEVK